MSAVFVKNYPDPVRAAAAIAHHQWLTSLRAARVPALLDTGPHHLVFEHLGTRYPGPRDLVVLADLLGRVHAAAAQGDLAHARLDRPVVLESVTITDFYTPRTELLTTTALAIGRQPVAFYKDCNIRNFVLTDDGPALLDFDDLTLAPFGYDLAKLIVSAAMTHGALPIADIQAALTAYNTATTTVRAECGIRSLRTYCRLHHRLTQRYLHRNGYLHSWADVSPWPDPHA